MQQHLIARVLASEAALELIRMLRQKHGPLVFSQSGGCCDGSAPMCFPADDFNISASDIYLGNLDGVPFYMGAGQYEYWKHTQLIIDVVNDNGGMFSLENGTGKRFLTRPRLFAEMKSAAAAATA